MALGTGSIQYLCKVDVGQCSPEGQGPMLWGELGRGAWCLLQTSVGLESLEPSPEGRD